MAEKSSDDVLYCDALLVEMSRAIKCTIKILLSMRTHIADGQTTLYAHPWDMGHLE